MALRRATSKRRFALFTDHSEYKVFGRGAVVTSFVTCEAPRVARGEGRYSRRRRRHSTARFMLLGGPRDKNIRLGVITARAFPAPARPYPKHVHPPPFTAFNLFFFFEVGGRFLSGRRDTWKNRFIFCDAFPFPRCNSYLFFPERRRSVSVWQRSIRNVIGTSSIFQRIWSIFSNPTTQFRKKNSNILLYGWY